MRELKKNPQHKIIYIIYITLRKSFFFKVEDSPHTSNVFATSTCMKKKIIILSLSQKKKKRERER